MKNFCVVIFSIVLILCAFFELGDFVDEDNNFIRMRLGGVRDFKGVENSAITLARFAVQEHNKRENSFLELARVLSVREQVVAGKIYHLTIEAVDAGKKKIYEAKVWVKPWMNFKQLQEFKPAQNGPSFTTADLGVKPEGYGLGWQAIPTDDLEVQDAANHAVKSIQQRSNSIYPYELLEILLAKAKVIEDYARFELSLKLRRGINVEQFRVEVIKNKGKFYMN